MLRIVVCVIVFFVGITRAWAEQALFYKELNLIGGYSEEGKWVGKSSELMNSIGLEYYRKFSSEYGDFLTMDLQLRIAYDAREASHDAWGLEIHNAWLQYKLGPIHKLKIGHFDTPFGLEQVLDTHATLLQTLAPRNIGYKKDWGIAWEGAYSGFDVSTAIQTGSGMSTYQRNGSFLATARIGTPSARNVQGGISFMYGEVLESTGMFTFSRAELTSGEPVLKKRIGADGQYLFGQFLLKSEMAFGRDGAHNVLGYLGEVDYIVPRMQNLQLELQYQSWRHDNKVRGSDDSVLTAGISHKLNSQVTLRLAFAHELNRMEGSEDNVILAQCYFLGW